jgi:hypothetical protein
MPKCIYDSRPSSKNAFHMYCVFDYVGRKVKVKLNLWRKLKFYFNIYNDFVKLIFLVACYIFSIESKTVRINLKK